MLWITKENEKIKISDMSNEHIINAIKWLISDSCFGLLKKDGLSDIEWVFELSKELVKRNKETNKIIERRK